jgi:hypothetical protein
MLKMHYLLFGEIRQHLRNSLRHLRLPLLVVRSHNKTIDVDHRKLFLAPFGFHEKSAEDVEEFDGVDGEVHVDVVEFAEGLL